MIPPPWLWVRKILNPITEVYPGSSGDVKQIMELFFTLSGPPP